MPAIMYVYLVGVLVVGAGGNLLENRNLPPEWFRTAKIGRVENEDLLSGRECVLPPRSILKGYDRFPATRSNLWGPESDAVCKRSEQIACLNLGLRGGQKTKTVKRSKSSPKAADRAVLKKKRPQPAYNLPPPGWKDKVKKPELQRKELSGKGHAKGRKKTSFHYWTKKKIKTFIEERMKHRELVRKQQAKLPIKNFGRGVRRCKFKWLPSEYEKEVMALEEARKKKEKAEAEGEGAEEAKDAGTDAEAEPEAAADAEEEPVRRPPPADEPEEEFAFPGMDGDSDGPGF